MNRARAARWANVGEPLVVWASLVFIACKFIWPAYLPPWGIATMPLWGPIVLWPGGFAAYRIARALILAALHAVLDE